MTVLPYCGVRSPCTNIGAVNLSGFLNRREDAKGYFVNSGFGPSELVSKLRPAVAAALARLEVQSVAVATAYVDYFSQDFRVS